jgi:hypothetical protein
MCKNLALKKNVVEFLAIEDGKKHLILARLFFSIGLRKKVGPPITLQEPQHFCWHPRDVRWGVYNVFPVQARVSQPP